MGPNGGLRFSFRNAKKRDIIEKIFGLASLAHNIVISHQNRWGLRFGFKNPKNKLIIDEFSGSLRSHIIPGGKKKTQRS